MPTFSQYTPQPFTLDGGMDNITPKVAVNAGTLGSCYNMERTDRVGYSRVMGYEYFDGGFSPSLAYTNTAYVLHATSAFSIAARTPLKISGSDKILGCCISHASTKTLIAITEFDEWRRLLATTNAGGSVVLEDVNGVAPSITITAVQSFEDGYTPTGDARSLTIAKNTYFQAINTLVNYPGPATNPVIGLVGFKDHVYAIKDLPMVGFSDGTDAKRVYPNATLRKNGGTSDTDLYVADIIVTSGDWITNDAAGRINYIRDAGAPVPGSYDLVNPVDDTVLQSNAVLIAASSTAADWAGFWVNRLPNDPYGSQGGWDPVKLGFQMEFDSGTAYGPFRTARRGEFSDYTSDVATAQGHGTTGSSTNGAGTGGHVVSTWTITPTGNVPASVNNPTGTSNRASCVMTGTLDATNIPYLTLGAMDIPNLAANSGATIKGVEVQIRYRHFGTAGASGTVTAQMELQTGGTTITGSSVYLANMPTNLQETFLTFGGSEDLWGLTPAGMQTALDPTTIGTKLSLTMTPLSSTSSNTNTVQVFDLKVIVHFTQEITQYYFYDGVDDVTADVTYARVTSTDDGSWVEGAAGLLQVTNIQPDGAATRNYIKYGDQVWTEPLGTGLQIATISTEMSYNGLDTLAELEDKESRYQFITANFYGQEQFEAIYGVSGAGRAFSYDGFYFTRIVTLTDEAADKPRHVAQHQGHLALGFKAGVVELSATGNPLDFLALNGAAEIDTGDSVVGFAKMQGTTLGVFCKNTIQGIIGTSVDNFSLNILGPYEGAIEYTCCDIGKPVFCSYRGLSVFDQTAAYGDFAGQRLSYAVSPWLLPRLQGAVNPLGIAATTSGPVVAIPVRTKNQLRLYFGDGYCLVMTLAGAEQTPMFTIRADCLYDDSGVFSGYFTPRAETSFVDSSGAEHIVMGHYSRSSPLAEYQAYEFEKSWTYGGVGIPSYVVTNEMFLGTPYNYDNVRKLRLHGLSLGYAPIKAVVKHDYDLNEAVLQEARECPDLSLPREDRALTLSYDYNPTTSMGNFATRGRSFNVRFISYDIDNQISYLKDPVYADICPPFVIQAMIPQFTENKGDV